MTAPLPPHGHAGRQQQTQALLDESRPSVLVSSPVNVRWLTGFTGSNGSVLLTTDQVVFVTDARYEDRVRSLDGDLDLLVTSSPVADAVTWLVDHDVSSVALEATAVSWADAEQWQSVATAASVAVTSSRGLVEGLRAVKESSEIARIREACRITSVVLSDVIGRLTPGTSEREVSRMLEEGFTDQGAEAAAFDAIVATGPNGAIPHHEPSGRRLELGDLVTIDCGARVDGYHADCTRTVALGDPGSDWRRRHALVAVAQEAGRAAVRAGVAGKQVDRAARSVIVEHGHGEHFVHGTGHGIGLQIHEAPAIGERATSTLAAGMTVTVEPGIYLSGSGGIRIEDTLLVTEDGSDILTDLPRDLQIL